MGATRVCDNPASTRLGWTGYHSRRTLTPVRRLNNEAAGAADNTKNGLEAAPCSGRHLGGAERVAGVKDILYSVCTVDLPFWRFCLFWPFLKSATYISSIRSLGSTKVQCDLRPRTQSDHTKPARSVRCTIFRAAGLSVGRWVLPLTCVKSQVLRFAEGFADGLSRRNLSAFWMARGWSSREDFFCNSCITSPRTAFRKSVYQEDA